MSFVRNRLAVHEGWNRMTLDPPGTRRGLAALLRDPLLHYLLIGLALTAAFGVLRTGPAGEDELRIQVDAARIQWLHRSWEARWQRPPTAVELRGLVDDHVRQEVLYRTGLAMGLDRDDEVFRRRIQQKIEMMTEDLATQVQPAEVELQAFLETHLDVYRVPEQRGFSHIYFNRDARGDEAFVAATELLAELQASPAAPVRAAELGDRFMLAHEFEPLPRQRVGREFGEAFATALFGLAPGSWQGPVASAYGLHLVRVDEVTPGREPELAEVRDEVRRDFLEAARQRARQEVYANLAREYTIAIDEEALDALPVTPAPSGNGR